MWVPLFFVCVVAVPLQAESMGGLGGWVQISTDDCWDKCGGKGGLCEDGCGSQGYCCRKGYGDCPSEAGDASPNNHSCVGRTARAPSLTVSSTGPAATAQSSKMGDYLLTDQTFNKFPVYEKAGGGQFIYVDNGGYWSIMSELHPTRRGIYHPENNPTRSLPPVTGWHYYDGGWKNDEQLTVTQTGVPATLGPWTEWTCDQECFFPNREEETTESRTRTCRDGVPRHSFRNCENVQMKQSTGPCSALNRPQNDRRKIWQCPILYTVRASTCLGEYDGSNDNVKIALKNGIGDICSTEYHEDSWDYGTIQTWSGYNIGTCSALQPVNGELSAQIQVNTWGWNVHYNDLKVCYIEVRYIGNKGSSRWWWGVEEDGVTVGDDYGIWLGAYDKTSSWITLRNAWNVTFPG